MAASGCKASSLFSNTSSSSMTDNSFEHISTGSSRRSSLIFLDIDKNPFRVDMSDMSEGGKNISLAMAEVLSMLNRICSHIRANGGNIPANQISQSTVTIVNVFNATVGEWNDAMAMMPPADPPMPSPELNGTIANAVDPPKASRQGPATTSWAAVAAVAPAKGNKLIKYTPEDTLQMRVEESRVTPVVTDPELDKRVLWIRGWSKDKPLSEVTDRIGQGPVYSMAYSEIDSAVCIIFQFAYSAKALFMDDQQHVKKEHVSRFGPGCDIVEGLPFPENDDFRKMLSPFNERRRLTFARSQLFTNGMTEAKFRNDLYSVVGVNNVELVWLFNTGNATVVISAVPLARLVRNHFIKLARGHDSPYKGVIITFSHDPCERPMTLITQIPNGNQQRPPTTYGRSGVAPPELMIKSRASGRRNTVHEVDGWQTVGRRR